MFLGFCIKDGGRTPSKEKTRSMQVFLTPKLAEEVQKFIGLINYFRELIPNYAKLASPLQELSRKNTKFEWNKQRNMAFIELKLKLCAEPVVQLPNLNKPFILKTDASGTGMGAVLLQGDKDARCLIKRS